MDRVMNFLRHVWSAEDLRNRILITIALLVVYRLAAHIPLPGPIRGAVDMMGEDHVLLVLFEYGPESVGKALFRKKGLPTRLTPNMFSGSALQRTLPGQAGCQLWFTEANRAFCLYTVLGRHSAAARRC